MRWTLIHDKNRLFPTCFYIMYIWFMCIGWFSIRNSIGIEREGPPIYIRHKVFCHSTLSPEETWKHLRWVLKQWDILEFFAWLSSNYLINVLNFIISMYVYRQYSYLQASLDCYMHSLKQQLDRKNQLAVNTQWY